MSYRLLRGAGVCAVAFGLATTGCSKHRASSDSTAAQPTTPAGSAARGAPTTTQDAMIHGAVASHEKETRACYRRGLAERPDLGGKVTVKFEVDPKGKVLGKPHIASSTLE